MDLRRLALFLAVVDHGGFTAAAKAVFVAQPAVSLAVKELESELGATLLVRSRRGVTLTPAGQALVGPARQALRDVEVARAAVAGVTGLVAGRLGIAALPTLAADPLAEIVGRFCRAHPAVAVQIVALTDPAELAEAVLSGPAELGVTEGGLANRALDEDEIVQQVLVAVSPPGTRPGRGPLVLDQLGALPLVLTPPGSSLRELVGGALSDAGIVANVAVETEQRDALVPLALAGAGTTFVPDGLAASAAAIGAVVRPTVPPLRRDVVLVRRPGPISPAAERFRALATGLRRARTAPTAARPGASARLRG